MKIKVVTKVTADGKEVVLRDEVYLCEGCIGEDDIRVCDALPSCKEGIWQHKNEQSPGVPGVNQQKEK